MTTTACLLYGDHTAITPAQERALVSFVEGGKGVVALNAAIEMFPASSAYADLIGARGQRKGAARVHRGVAPGRPAPILKGLQPFSTTDDTYTFTRQSAAGRTVLMERVEGGVRTPQTWTRTQGKGRVFYTAYGNETDRGPFRASGSSSSRACSTPCRMTRASAGTS